MAVSYPNESSILSQIINPYVKEDYDDRKINHKKTFAFYYIRNCEIQIS